MTMLDNWWAQRFFRLLRSHSTSDSCYILHDPNHSTNLENILPFTLPSTINVKSPLTLNVWLKNVNCSRWSYLFLILTNVYRFKTDHTISNVKVQNNNEFNLSVVENCLLHEGRTKIPGEESSLLMYHDVKTAKMLQFIKSSATLRQNTKFLKAAVLNEQHVIRCTLILFLFKMSDKLPLQFRVNYL